MRGESAPEQPHAGPPPSPNRRRSLALNHAPSGGSGSGPMLAHATAVRYRTLMRGLRLKVRWRWAA